MPARGMAPLPAAVARLESGTMLASSSLFTLGLVLRIAVAVGSDELESANPLLGARPLSAIQEAYLQDLIKSFGDADPDRRHDAVEKVARAGDGAVPLLIATLNDTTNPAVTRSVLF